MSQDQPDESAYLGFEIITLVPFEPSLIVPQLMTHKQVKVSNLKFKKIELI
jgi:C-terminal region of peptidase_M24